MSQKIVTQSLESVYSLIYKRVDGKPYKIWNTGLTEKFRKGHAENDGKMLPIDSLFVVNDESMISPGDSLGTESDHCSCWLYYGVDI